MPAPIEDDWSDSDDEIATGVETNVLLGIPDGSVETETDIEDAAVSRIGGLPAFLPSREPPFSSSQCKVCSNPMELLVQVWCPFEDSPMDRALYMWGCARSSCQRQAGSIRAWRGLRYNATYAAKLEKKRAQKQARQKAASPPKIHAGSQPMQSVAAPMAFGFGDQIFGKPTSDTPNQSPLEQDDDHSDADGDDSSASEDSLLTALASATLRDSIWTVAPSYPAIYLSTMPEYIPQPAKSPKILANAGIEDTVEDDGKTSNGATWALEAFENSLEVDNVFDRFTSRVSHTGEQCFRYELKGMPLPFASDEVFESLFPAPPQNLLPVTRANHKIVPAKSKAVQDALKRSKEPGSRGMEWGTCMVFSCENDCCLGDGGKDAKESWREEHVLVQWDE
ncbi:programmed cell death protein 2 [Melanogaster broomeanus]|nr:programmed cell death protein 2 [Melanogaster broomeanus]